MHATSVPTWKPFEEDRRAPQTRPVDQIGIARFWAIRCDCGEWEILAFCNHSSTADPSGRKFMTERAKLFGWTYDQRVKRWRCPACSAKDGKADA